MARLNTRPLIAGAVIGGVTAVAILLLPHTALESILNRTHLGDVLKMAQPPIGTKARVLLALIPFAGLTLAGLAIGILLGRRRSAEEDFGAYPIYDLGAPPSSDPFAPAEAAFTPPPAPVAAEPVAPEPVPAPPPAPAPEASPPAVAAAAAPQPAVTSAPLDSATAADLAEIADAVVRLSARVDAIEARLDAAPAATAGGVVPAGLAERLQKIARALDDAG